MLLLVGVLAVASSCLADTVILNQVVDGALEGLNRAIREAGKDWVDIPDLDHDWEYRWHFFRLSGRVSCRGGRAGSLASIRRNGDVGMTVRGNQTRLGASLGLGALEAVYRRCRFEASHLFSATRRVSASVASGSVEARATLTGRGGRCRARLDSIALVRLGRISVRTGGGVLRAVEGTIVDWLTEQIHDRIVGSINAELQKLAYANFHKADLCNRIPH